MSHPDDSKAATKELWERNPTLIDQEARSIGFYSAGSFTGGATLLISEPV
jgi:hypothetical protein